MKTIGDIVRQARLKKRFSLSKLEKETRIKAGFTQAIEDLRWGDLPEFPVVVGFVKSISKSLGISERHAVSLLKRDYPPKNLHINPKPDVSDKFTWSPRFTFWLATVLVTTLVLGYLGYQYVRFVNPPFLEIYEPRQGQEITARKLEVSGKTVPDALVTINNQPVLVEDGGGFSSQISIFEGTQEVEIKAISRSGKETVVRRKIIPRIGK